MKIYLFSAALKTELMGKLDKEVKSLDDDSWMFDGPRSRINLISRPGKSLNWYIYKIWLLSLDETRIF